MRQVRNLFLLWIALSFTAIQTLHAEAVWRLIYEDEAILADAKGKPLQGAAREERLKLLKETYGANVRVIKGAMPPKPKRVGGTVLHIDVDKEVGDSNWILGDKNPNLEFQKLKSDLAEQYGIKGDISDKWIEYQFLQKLLAEKIRPPEMHVLNEYGADPGESEKLAAVAKVRAKIAEYQTKSASANPDEAANNKRLAEVAEKNFDALIKLALTQDRIQNQMGNSIVKIRYMNHSEGKLPQTRKDWIDLYTNYLSTTKGRVAEIEKEIEGTSTALATRIVELPFIAGRVLERVLVEPENVIAQQMVKIKREVRMHIVDGKILPDATFLRFYALNEYLSEDEKKKIHDTIQTEFLDKLQGKAKHFYATPDVAILEDGRVIILDFNDGIDSGYYYPEEDLFTTNRLASAISGKKTPFLREFDKFLKLPVGKEKSQALMDIRKKHKIFMKGDVLQAFWDRVLPHYLQELKKNPTSANYSKILWQLRDAGLDSNMIYAQFLSQVQDELPGLKLTAKQAQNWAKYLNKLDPEIYTGVNKEGYLVNAEIPDPRNTCEMLKKISKPNPY